MSLTEKIVVGYFIVIGFLEILINSLRKRGRMAFKCIAPAAPHVDLARTLGAERWIFQLVCMVDPPMTEGFNPNIGFRRSKILMQGDECCDHFYFMEKQD